MTSKDSTGISGKLARQLLLCLLPLILFGCGKIEKEGDRTLRLGGLGGPPGPINQIITNGTISVNLADLVYSPLVRINERMLPEPALAERWQVSSDGLTYTFYLRSDAHVRSAPYPFGASGRQGVKFHDGTEFTAEDCAFTYNAILDPATKSPWRDNYIMINTVKAEDRYTFTVTLREPQASFINLMNFPIVPKHLLDGKDIRSAEFNRHPIGTGPFRFSAEGGSASGGKDSIILEANPDYYEGRPQIDRIIATGYDTFPEYFSAFMKGQIDFIQFLSPEQYETVSRDPAFRACSFPSIYTYMIDYNPKHPLFADKRVRQAMAYAINIPEIIRKVESGLGIQSTGPFLPGAWFSCPVRSEHTVGAGLAPARNSGQPQGLPLHPKSDASNGADPSIKPLEYNPAEAMRLLKEAGWELNSNSILEIPSPFPLPAPHQTSPHRGEDKGEGERIGEGSKPAQFRFTLLVDSHERITETIAKIIYQDLFKIGVRCDIKTYDHLNQDKALVESAGAAVISIRILADLEPSWHSDKQHRTGKLWRYNNPEIDALFEQADRTQDLKERTRIYHQLHRLVYADQSGTFLYNLPNLAAINKRFGNTNSFFTAAMPFYTIKDWEIR